ncbi:acetyl-CoA carboxylase biotin carboxylase subunit family protein [Kitasatospora sp. NPDC057223]|uniref:ATP-grasp domain-containing protein n=1 Tax=Kitasatospora sp. NPDC057223 TaxID=3346055 RepID=UPI00363A4A55
MSPGPGPAAPARTGQHIVHVGFHASDAHAVDFDADLVTAVMPRASAARLPGELAARFARIALLDLPDTDDLDTYDHAFERIRELVDALAAEFGPPAAVVGMYEHTTLPAARLREHLGIRGTTVRTALLCRDKVPMKEAVAAAGVPVPRFLPVGPRTGQAELADFAARTEGRIVLKPRSQAASRGVRVLDDAAALLELAAAGALEAGYQAEEFVAGSIHHIDAVVRDGAMRWFCASRYLDSCFDFQYGDAPLAAVTADDPALVSRIRAFTASVLEPLGLRDSVIHLELFHTPDDELVFLEIGNRFGGAGVPWHQRTAFGVDLVREAVLACLGRPSELRTPTTMLDHPDSSGWLYVPLAVKEPQVVTRVTGLGELPGSILDSSTPAVGDVLRAGEDVWPNAGRFLVGGRSSAEVEQAMTQIIATYAVTTAPVAAAPLPATAPATRPN